VIGSQENLDKIRDWVCGDGGAILITMTQLVRSIIYLYLSDMRGVA
jgi:hypothetical protein